MSSDGSFPHRQPQRGAPEEDDSPASGSARVLPFPSDELGPDASAATEASEDVPAGTWADDSAADRSEDRLLSPARGGEVLAFPRPADTSKRLRVPRESSPRLRDASGTQPTQLPAPARSDRSAAEPPPAQPLVAEAREEAEAPRPAFLASELLRFDWWPATPLRRTLRWGALSVGAIGAVAVLGLGGLGAEAVSLAGLLGACAAIAAAPLRPAHRGVALAAVGSLGAVGVGYLSARGGEAAAPLLVACVTLAASALFFRATHRQSKLARALVGVGLAATAGWLALSGGIDALIVETPTWQACVGPASRVLLGLVLLAGVLSFLDPRGHGGAWGTGLALLVWLGIEGAAGLALASWPAGRAAANVDLTQPEWLAAIALPLFCAITAGGLCQAWVLVSRRLRRRAPSAA